jgi:hypothetical protein
VYENDLTCPGPDGTVEFSPEPHKLPFKSISLAVTMFQVEIHNPGLSSC